VALVFQDDRCGKELESFHVPPLADDSSRCSLRYLLLPQGLVAAILDGLVSFGLASLMYRTTSKEIRLWGINSMRHASVGPYEMY